jgi:archaellum component FlaC
LATTVAGVRQQTQFMALMEEWSDIEGQVGNLSLGMDYLNKKNEEYANSLEGIKKQYSEVKKEFFDEVLNEDTLKGFYKTMIDLVNVAKNIVGNFGGV